MRRTLIGVTAAMCLVAAGCGSDSSEGGGTDGAAQPQAGGATQTDVAADAKKGGDVTMYSNGDIDFLDPGQIYYQFGFQVQMATNRTLYTFKPDDSETPVPDLADGEPQVSEDLKTITVKIKDGVKYSPPVNREVTSKDVKYAIERAFTSNVPSGYAFTYFDTIVGAPEEPVPYAKLEPFSGLQTPDDKTLVIKLKEPRAGLVSAALVMPITVPVPQEWAEKFDKEAPSTYDSHVAFTGPYMVESDPETGENIGREPGKRIKIVRNPNWDEATDDRPAFLDSVTISEGNADPAVSSRRTLSGEQSWCCGDASKPPPIILKQVLSRNRTQVGRASGGGAHYDTMNTRLEPFDNVNVRKAAIAITDRFAIRDVAGGEEIGPIAQGFIPPGIPGYEESGGEQGFSDLDFMQHADGGSAEVARKYMDLAEKDGAPVKDGKYTGDEEVVGVVASTPTSLAGAETLAADLEKIGIDLKIRQVPQDTLYTKYCYVPKNTPHMCIGVGWVKDFQDPETLMAPILPSDTIRDAGNTNMSLLEDPAVDKAIEEASLKPTGPERNQAFADANKVALQAAPVIMTTWDDNIQIQSKDMNSVMSAYNASWDISYSSVK